MPQQRRYQKTDRAACKQLIHDRCLQNETLLSLKALFAAELGIAVSPPTIANMKLEVIDDIEKVTSAAAAQAQFKALEKLKGIDTGRYVDMLNSQVEELYKCLYDETYKGDIPRPKNINDRLRMECQLSTAIQNLLSLMGPPKQPESSTYGGLIPKRDVMALLAEREEVYKVEYLRMRLNPQNASDTSQTPGDSENIVPENEEEAISDNIISEVLTVD